MALYLCCPTDGWYLEPAEILRRVADAFPQAIIEAGLADHCVKVHYEYLVQLDAPKIVLELWNGIVGNTAFVAIQLQSIEGYLWFQVTPASYFEVNYLTHTDWETCKPMEIGPYLFNDRLHVPTPNEWLACGPTLEALAKSLEYEYRNGSPPID